MLSMARAAAPMFPGVLGDTSTMARREAVLGDVLTGEADSDTLDAEAASGKTGNSGGKDSDTRVLYCLKSGPPGIWPLGVQSPEVPQMFDHLSTQGWLALTWVTLTSATAGFMNTIACGTGRDGTPLVLWPTASTRSP